MMIQNNPGIAAAHLAAAASLSKPEVDSVKVQHAMTKMSGEAVRAGNAPPLADQAKSASGTLGAYMHEKGMTKVDVNELYALSNNKSGDVPADVQKAAGFMLKHPAIYEKIETSDVKGADGISGVNNFDKAAQGLTNFKPDLPQQPHRMVPAEMNGMMQRLHETEHRPMMPTSRSVEPLADQAQGAAGTLGAYMHDKGMTKVDVNELYALSNNKTGDVPADVQKAATFMLKNPEIYEKIETSDVSGADGIAGVNNFDKAAQGSLDDEIGQLEAAKAPISNAQMSSMSALMRAVEAAQQQLGFGSPVTSPSMRAMEAAQQRMELGSPMTGPAMLAMEAAQQRMELGSPVMGAGASAVPMAEATATVSPVMGAIAGAVGMVGASASV